MSALRWKIIQEEDIFDRTDALDEEVRYFTSYNKSNMITAITTNIVQ